MPVGTGSIKRAAKANVAAGTKAESVPEVKVDKAAVKKQATAKKVAAPKKTEPKKAESKVTTAVIKSVNEVCHLTEELPIHLL
ncbi:MAG: hypothetical protein IJ324_08270 [Lachnospiraceae bacterium]|nr:hypothetical protein [Lachnospiraceae bacterium]